VLFILKNKRDSIVEKNIEWQPTEMKSRGISLGKHEKCEFPYEKVYEDKQLGMLGFGKAKKKKAQGEDSSSSDEYDIDEGDEMDYQIVERDEVNPMDEGKTRNFDQGASKEYSRDQDDDDYDNRGSRGNRSNSRY